MVILSMYILNEPRRNKDLIHLIYDKKIYDNTKHNLIDLKND